MKTKEEYMAFIRNDDNWVLISETENIRTQEIRYRGVCAFRQEKLKNGKWRKDFWYRFNPAYKPVKMDIHDFVSFLELIDRQRPDQGGGR
jgi:hypothetical protein